MNLDFIFKNKGFGIRRPKFNLALHKWLGRSETLFSPVQIRECIIYSQYGYEVLKKEERRRRREKKKATMKGETVQSLL